MDPDAELRREIGRRFRRRFAGVWVCVAAAGVFSLGVIFATPMIHGGGDFHAVSATIVALGTGSSGEPTFTSEFTDADGVVHRDTNSYGYHYAKGDPRIGQRVRYLYEAKPETDTFHAFPRADGILRWLFGTPTVFFLLLAAIFVRILQRERGTRLRLLREGRREAVAQPSIRERSVVIPAGGNSHRVDTWRLEGRYFDPARGEYVDCHGDWESPPIPQLHADTVLAPLLVDPADSSRYWLPSGGLVPAKR